MEFGPCFHQQEMEEIMKPVEPDMPWSGARLDKLESDMMKRLMTMENYGGINLRVERRRGVGGN